MGCLICSATFALGITLAKINQVSFIENLKIYWERFESKQVLSIQCYHSTRESQCTNAQDVSTCTNCKDSHPVNYSKCPALLAFLAKKNAYKIELQTNIQHQYLPSTQTFPILKRTTNYTPSMYKIQNKHTCAFG